MNILNNTFFNYKCYYINCMGLIIKNKFLLILLNFYLYSAISIKLNSSEIINEKFETSLASSLYGYTKLSSEKLIREFSYTNKMNYIINRFGVIAGPWQFGKQDQGFVPLWIARHIFKKNFLTLDLVVMVIK